MKALVALVALFLVGCGEDTAPRLGATWYGEVGELVRDKCAGCHRPDGIAPFSLYDLGDAQDQMARVLDAIDTGLMPPFSMTDAPDCAPRHGWRDDPRLTPREMALMHSWVDAGGPGGEPRALRDTPSTTLDDATIKLEPDQDFTASGDRDQFVCVLLDPHLTDTSWLTASQVYPRTAQIVHHANVQIVAPGAAAAAIEQLGGIGVAKDGCFTPPGVPYQSWLPGNPALVLPPSVGIPVPAGTLISLQIHYHPAGGTWVDRTGVELRLSHSAPAWSYELGVYGNETRPGRLRAEPDDPETGPVFVIPANRGDHVETMDLPLPATLSRELRVMSVTPHMHLLGTHERATLTHKNGDTECLFDSDWNFDWQRSYPYDASFRDLPLLDAGGVVTVECHWNNTFENPNLTRLLRDEHLSAPYDVRLGLDTTDEMCLADLGTISPAK